ncbi:MAG: glycosyltransferase family 39 protein, partial [Thermoplasmata archaeon]|nr:glycosyltransferase family 39 protein [Thermoplasmata archaeon]
MTLSDTLKANRRTVAAVIAVVLLALLLRLYSIDWSYSNNGIDEGIMVERVLMVDAGYPLYSDIPCDQSPLSFYLGSLFWGDVASLRVLTALFSVSAIGACMVVARRIGGSSAMVATGLLLAVDFALLRESRTFSLDGHASFFLAFSLLAFSTYLARGNRTYLVATGLLIGLAASSKLLACLGLVGILLFIAIEVRRRRTSLRDGVRDASMVTVASAVPIVLLMLALGPSEMIDGMLLSQTHREFDPFLKLSVVAYFGLCVAYALPLVFFRRLWGLGPQTRFLLCGVASILVFMVIQSLVFLHHMVLLSPYLAILSGVLFSAIIERNITSNDISRMPIAMRKDRAIRRVVLAVFVAGVFVSSGLGVYGLVAQGEPAQVAYARVLENLTDEGDWVVSGDPMIAAMAGCLVPPEVINVAYRQYPDLTLEMLEDAITEYDVRVVIVCYRLNDIAGLTEFLSDAG